MPCIFQAITSISKDVILSNVLMISSFNITTSFLLSLLLKDAVSEVDLKEECLSVGVVSLDANKKERWRSDERRKDLRQLCLDADVCVCVCCLLE